MKLVEIKEREILNNFLIKQKHSQFLQSWEWGEFNKALGFGVKALGVEENGKLVMVATLIKKNLGLGKSYWFCPRGPIVNYEPCLPAGRLRITNYELIINFLFFELNKTAKNDEAIFLRFEPLFKIQNSTLPAGRQEFKIQSTLDIQPAKTLILDLEKSEEEILKSMHQKTRYNIRLAEKKGVVAREAEMEKDFEAWWEIMEETKDRDGFKLHSKEHYKKMLTSPQPSPCKGEGVSLVVKLIVAEYNGEIIAGNIISFFGDMATYIHGASSNEFRNVMAPYLLQWEVIKIAKSAGYKYYDFYGIDENKWPGVTRFKLGFGGEEINYPGTFDLIFNKFYYNFYKILRKIRRLI